MTGRVLQEVVASHVLFAALLECEFPWVKSFYEQFEVSKSLPIKSSECLYVYYVYI